MKNYYRIMYMARESFTLEKLEGRYKTFNEMIEKSLKEYENNPEKITKLREMSEEFNEAYRVLSDEKKRNEYDALLDEEKRKVKDKKYSEEQSKEEKQRKAKQEKFGCFEMYDSSLIKSVKFRRNTIGKIFFLPYEFNDGKVARKVECELMGFISYTTERKDVNNRLARYEVKNISTQNPETKRYIVITPVIDYDELCENEKYKKTVYEKLFSEKNLEKSKHENYEYLGKIIKDKDGYDIDYDKEEFCASVRFGIKLKRRVDNPNKPKVGIIGKFKNKLKKKKLIYKEDDYER